jgi:hypothetical protein
MIFRNIYTFFLVLSTGFLSANSLQAQDDAPISGIWGNRLANHQTAELTPKGTTTMFIVHYFDQITANGISDWFGIYGTSNIQMGFERTFGKNFSAFYHTEKLNKTHELGARFQLTRQTLSDTSPVSSALSFSVSADARNKKFFGDNFYFINRFFFTTQLAVSRQISPRMQVMSNTTFVHFNIVPDRSYSDFLAENLSLAWRANRKTSLYASCDFPLGVASAASANPQKPKPVYALGTILATPTHNFQVFVSNASQISLGKEYLNNRSGFSLDALRIGFSIQVKIGKGKKTQPS